MKYINIKEKIKFKTLEEAQLYRRSIMNQWYRVDIYMKTQVNKVLFWTIKKTDYIVLSHFKLSN